MKFCKYIFLFIILYIMNNTKQNYFSNKYHKMIDQIKKLQTNESCFLYTPIIKSNSKILLNECILLDKLNINK